MSSFVDNWWSINREILWWPIPIMYLWISDHYYQHNTVAIAALWVPSDTEMLYSIEWRHRKLISIRDDDGTCSPATANERGGATNSSSSIAEDHRTNIICGIGIQVLTTSAVFAFRSTPISTNFWVYRLSLGMPQRFRKRKIIWVNYY